MNDGHTLTGVPVDFHLRDEFKMVVLQVGVGEIREVEADGRWRVRRMGCKWGVPCRLL